MRNRCTHVRQVVREGAGHRAPRQAAATLRQRRRNRDDAAWPHRPEPSRLIVNENVMVVYAAAGKDRAAQVEQAVAAL